MTAAAARTPLVRLGLAWCVLWVCAPAASAQASTPNTSADSSSFFRDYTEAYAESDRINAEILGGDLPPARRDSLGYAAGVTLVRRGLDPANADVAANAIYALVTLAARLPRRLELLQATSDLLAAYAPADTSRQHRANYLLARACLELNREDLRAAELYLDSIHPERLHWIDPCLLGNVYATRGHVYAGLDDHERALAAYVEAAEILGERCVGNYGQHHTYAYAAEVAVRLGRVTMALDFGRRAVAFVEEPQTTGHSITMTEVYSSYLAYARALALAGDYPEAIRTAERGVAISKAGDGVVHVVRALAWLAQIHAAAGDLPEAERTLQRISTSGDGEPIEAQTQMLICEVKAECRAAAGDYAGVVALTERRFRIRDSLRAESQVYKLRELRDRHANASMRKDLELARAEAAAAGVEVERGRFQRIAFALAIALLLLAGGLLAYRLHARRRRESLLKAMVAERTAELTAQTEVLSRRTRALDAQTVELRRSNAELERFAYIASHDLKTPIRNVTSFLGLLRRRIAPAPGTEIAEYFQLAATYAKQLDTIVTDVLEFSRLDEDLAEQCTTFPLGGRIRNLARYMATDLEAANATVEVVGDAEVTLPESYVDQVATNLIANALKYNESPFPRVRIDISVVGGRGGDRDSRVRIAFADNGIGIAAEYHEQVFELFKRLHTSDRYTGTGLGLSVCRKVADRLGGTIAVASAPGAGSTFTVELPLDYSATSRPTAAESASPSE